MTSKISLSYMRSEVKQQQQQRFHNNILHLKRIMMFVTVMFLSGMMFLVTPFVGNNNQFCFVSALVPMTPKSRNLLLSSSVLQGNTMFNSNYNNNDNNQKIIRPRTSKEYIMSSLITRFVTTSVSDETTTPSDSDDSPRLSKAKRLLEQFSDDIDAIPSSSSSSSKVVTAPKIPSAPYADNFRSKSSSTSSSTTTTAIEKNSAAATSSTTLVPDNDWSNGLLDGSDYVTRYAFRRGVKVAEPLVKYDPIKAEKLLFRQPAKWFVRNIQIAVPLGWWAAGVVFDFIVDGGTSQSNRRIQRAIQLQKAISGLGPAIIKAGQALASRPDLLPSEYLDELQKLQDDVPRFSNEIAFKTIEEELNIKFEDVFELVQDEPVAAASIGQVYQARLKANGDLVALKIQRPKCEEIIALDLYILRWWSGIYNQIFKWLNRDINVQSIIDDFGELIYREIDYVAEAANTQRFNELYAGVRDVFVPKVYSDLTTRKVLVMEWVDGVRLTDANGLQRYGLQTNKLVQSLVQCSLRQILENGFFHADPHAGNLLACPDGRLCYLDFGMMSYADKNQRNLFLLAVVHIVNRDWSELLRVYQRLGFIPLDTDLKPIEVALENSLPDVLNADISELNFKNVITALGDIMYTFPFSLPPFYIAIIRCLGVLEGVAIQVDPSSRIISEAYPYVASRVLTDPQEQLQEALRRLALTSDGHVRWDRLEGLLDEAKDSSGYDVAAAIDLLTDYLISDEGEPLLQELTQEIVNAADSLGTESLEYVIKASKALSINDEVAAVKAFRSLQSMILQRTQQQLPLLEGGGGDKSSNSRSSDNNKNNNIILSNEYIQEVLPEPTPSMQRFGRILSLLDTSSSSSSDGDNTNNSAGSSSSSDNNNNGTPDVARFVPIIRKLAQEPQVQRTANEIVARLGERVLSRSLRALFGLPPPVFDGTSRPSSTVFEQEKIQ